MRKTQKIIIKYKIDNININRYTNLNFFDFLSSPKFLFCFIFFVFSIFLFKFILFLSKLFSINNLFKLLSSKEEI